MGKKFRNDLVSVISIKNTQPVNYTKFCNIFNFSLSKFLISTFIWRMGRLWKTFWKAFQMLK